MSREAVTWIRDAHWLVLDEYIGDRLNKTAAIMAGRELNRLWKQAGGK